VCLGESRDPSGTQSLSSLRHCDTSRGDRKLFLHPVQGQGGDPREHLRYTLGGKVEPAIQDERVQADINALNLNARRLVRAREAVFEALWSQLKSKGFATGELQRQLRKHEIVSGEAAPAHAEFLRYHLRKKLRSKG
jgi:hypothetical protein